MKLWFDWFNNLYPIWLVTLAVVAFLHPPVMLWFTSDWGFWSLAASMLGMQNGGMAASLAQLHFATMPLAAAAGVFSGVMGGRRKGQLQPLPRERIHETIYLSIRQHAL